MLTLKVFEVATGTCSFAGREGPGLKVAFDNEEPRFLSFKSFQKLLAYRMPSKVEQKPAVVPMAK